MILEAMIVDDEAPARVELSNQLDRTGRVAVVDEAVCLQEAVAKMQNRNLDVVFIDHNIAGAGTNLLAEALAHLQHKPMLIYMTAFSNYQDEPFGVEPLGYLVKPVDIQRLNDVISLLENHVFSKVNQ